MANDFSSSGRKAHPLSQIKTELIWEGKYDAQGRRVAPLRVALPFQTVETVNESAQDRQRSLRFDFPGVRETEQWRNRLIWGDKKYVLPSLLEEFAGQVNVIYIDPPFDTGADFSFAATVPDHPDTPEDDSFVFTKQPSIIEQKAYRDTWGRGLESYLQWFNESVALLRDLLAETGTIYLHLDWRAVHYVKVLMDELFGDGNFVNEVVFKRRHAHSDAANLGTIHDTVLIYRKGHSAVWNPQFAPYTQEYIDTYYRYSDPDGRKWLSRSTTAPGGRGPVYEWNGVTRAWRYTRANMQKLHEAGTLFYTANGMPRYKQYLDEMPGMPLTTIWNDIQVIDSWSSEAVGYPTQKPKALLERIIKASSNEGDLVLDCFCGSGTTAAVAEKLKRRWIACDLGRFAIHTTRKRLLSIPRLMPFVVQNLGKYERQLWQVGEFGNGKEQETRKEIAERQRAYTSFILQLYHAKPIQGYPWLHGIKGGRMVHVGAVDGPVSVGDVTNIAAEFRKAIGTGKDAPVTNGVDVLGWDFAFELNEVAIQQSARANIQMQFLRIPRDVMDKRAVEQGDVQFFELAALSVDLKVEKRDVTLKLADFVIPPDDVPEEARKAVKHWSQWIDYWAVDWENKGDTFHNEWQTYRTRKEPALTLETRHTYDAAGDYTVAMKIIDILGNDTTKTVKVTVR
jgi:adenine-specific DNA-methyltransferase